MAEFPRPQLELTELLEEMLVVQTEHSSLGKALDDEGFYLSTDVRDHQRIVWFGANVDVLNAANKEYVALALTKEGIVHAPKYEGDSASPLGYTESEGRLISIEIPKYENTLNFWFRPPNKSSSSRTRITLTLKTVRTIEKGL